MTIYGKVTPGLVTMTTRVVSVAITGQNDLLTYNLLGPVNERGLDTIYPLTTIGVKRGRFHRVLKLRVGPPATNVVTFSIHFPGQLFSSRQDGRTQVGVVNGTRSHGL